MCYHNPVLLQESVEGLAIQPGGTYVDATFGGGGHSRAILAQLGAQGRLFALDQDAEAHENGFEDPRLVHIHQNFKYLKALLSAQGIKAVDGLLADLGVSSHQFDQERRGFSTRFDAPLDMRMNTKASLRACEVLNEYEEARLTTLFKVYGELRCARALARRIAEERVQSLIETTFQLREVLRVFAPRGRENRFYAQAFQALRIEVNGELEALQQLLEQSVQVLKPRGRLAVISYHSLEDRLVKRFLKTGNAQGELQRDFHGSIHRPFSLINRHVIRPSGTELERNKRARSAKLRIAEKR